MYAASVTLPEWYEIRELLTEYDVEAGEAHEMENVWDCRFYDEWTKDHAFYCGRDGWDQGFYHAKVYLEVCGEEISVHIEQGADDAQPLTDSLRMILSFIERITQKNHGG
jgi:hypothetical protein